MCLIFSIITAAPTLPSRFISNEYDRFLFFDIDLRANSEFLDSLQNTAGASTEISIFYSQTLSLVGEVRSGEKWSEKLKSVVRELANQGEYFGLIIAERKGGWVLVQDMPVNWGVFGLKSSDEHALEIFKANATTRDWFISTEHFERAISDPNSPIRESVDVQFMKAIVANYG